MATISTSFYISITSTEILYDKYIVKAHDLSEAGLFRYIWKISIMMETQVPKVLFSDFGIAD